MSLAPDPQATDQGRDLAIALALLRAGSPALGGLHLVARHGGAKSVADEAIRKAFPEQQRLHPDTGDDALYGAVDLVVALGRGETLRTTGLFERDQPLVLSNAERLRPDMASRIAQYLDTEPRQPVFAMDEGLEDDGGLPAALADRIAFRIDLTGIRSSAFHVPDLSATFEDLPPLTDRLATSVVEICDMLGVSGQRAVLFAIQAARLHTALHSRGAVTEDDLLAAVRLVLAHRATHLPERPPDDVPEIVENREGPPSETDLSIPEHLLLEAIAASLPADLLDRLKSKAMRGAKGSGSGSRQKGNRRGRPLPSRPGRLSHRQAVDVIATVRAAAPWQKIRGPGDQIKIFPSDIRLKRSETLSDRLLIFLVDASGSSAVSRLGEAKGAVELLLSQAYVRRDHVALISFRGSEAEMLLPPTRSLVRTKRKLADLPGGGGTPLASGLREALDLALRSGRQGMTATVILLTDGRPNIALNGLASRSDAIEDARSLARQFRRDQIESIVIDTGNRSTHALAELAETMGATYLPMPRVEASGLSRAVTQAMSA